MKKIKLSQGKYAIVDDEDFEFLNRIDWYITKCKSIYKDCYNVVHKFSGESKGVIFMHALLLKGKNGYCCMHKNSNNLDNRKENLINVPMHTIAHKSILRTLHKGKPVTSKYKGVWKASLKSSNGKIRFLAGIKKDKKLYHLGTFKNEKEAAMAYNMKARELYGEMAYQNVIN